MIQRTPLIIAAVLTAFVLVLIGGLAANMSQGSDPANAIASAGTLAEPNTSVSGGITEAQASTQVNSPTYAQTLPTDTAPAATPQASITPIVATATYPVQAAQAAQLALSAAPGATLKRTPELVSYEGVVAYEVQLDRGVAYVDANTGKVLYNGATAAASPESLKTPSTSYGQGDDGDGDDRYERDGSEGGERPEDSEKYESYGDD